MLISVHTSPIFSIVSPFSSEKRTIRIPENSPSPHLIIRVPSFILAAILPLHHPISFHLIQYPFSTISLLASPIVFCLSMNAILVKIALAIAAIAKLQVPLSMFVTVLPLALIIFALAVCFLTEALLASPSKLPLVCGARRLFQTAFAFHLSVDPLTLVSALIGQQEYSISVPIIVDPLTDINSSRTSVSPFTMTFSSQPLSLIGFSIIENNLFYANRLFFAHSAKNQLSMSLINDLTEHWRGTLTNRLQSIHLERKLGLVRGIDFYLPHYISLTADLQIFVRQLDQSATSFHLKLG